MISNHRNLEQAINLLRNAEGSKNNQFEYNQKRLARIEKALATRPVYIPMTFNLNAAAQTSGYNEISTPLPYDVIITGVISNNSERNIVLRESFQDTKICLSGEYRNLYLKLSELGGGNFNSINGKKGYLPLPSPLFLRRYNRLDVDIYKTDATADAEVLSVVFVGVRVYQNSTLDLEQKELVQKYLNVRQIPRPIFLKHKFDFDVAGLAGEARNVFSPECDEPLLIRGVRSNLSWSEVLIRVIGESEWTVDRTPIWAIAAEVENDNFSYLYFDRPVYLPARQVVEMQIFNGLDGVNFDAQTNNEITWICETV